MIKEETPEIPYRHPRPYMGMALRWESLSIAWRSAITAGLLLTVFIAVLAAVQFSTPDMPDNDGYYHIKMAELMRQKGLTPRFSWLPLTILNAREYYDHHFLFHVALIPFTYGDLRLGAKWASVIFASLAFLSVWWLLYNQKVPYAALWALGLLVVSEAFLFRMSITRAQSLSLAVLALGLNWMLQGKYERLLPLGFFYVWLYNAFPLLLAMTVIYVLACWLVERRLRLQPVLYSTAGIGLGLLVNPYFPRDLLFALRHILPKIADPTSVRVGSEWYPYATDQLLQNSPLALLAFFAGVLALGWSGKRMDLRIAMSLLLAMMFGLMLFQARRFVEYFPPFALIFAAFAFSPLLESAGERLRSGLSVYRTHTRRLAYAAGISVVLLVCLGISIFTLGAARESLRTSKPYQTYAAASRWLAENTPTGTRVFQTDWDDFPRLFFYNTHNTYIVGLDPTYLQIANPYLYQDWVAITQGKVKTPSSQIVDRFAASYVISDLRHTDFMRAARLDPNMEEVYRDQYSVVYQITQ